MLQTFGRGRGFVNKKWSVATDTIGHIFEFVVQKQVSRNLNLLASTSYSFLTTVSFRNVCCN